MRSIEFDGHCTASKVSLACFLYVDVYVFVAVVDQTLPNRVVTQRSSPLTAAHSSSAFLSLKLTNKEQASVFQKPGAFPIYQEIPEIPVGM